jgi:predicted NUDIX family phosphoesterase/thymidylate kinase
MDSGLEQRIGELESTAARVLQMLRPSEDAGGPPTAQRLSRPFIIEFAGTPKAGKTTAIENAGNFLRRNDFRVRTITEKASICPVKPKDHMFFNVWTACQTLSDLLASLDPSLDIVLVDRGLFDSLCWMRWHLNKGRLTQQEFRLITEFLRLNRWLSTIDLVFLLSVGPQEALRREHSRLLTKKPGTIMNETALQQFNDAIEFVSSEYAADFRHVHHKPTDNAQADRTTAEIVRQILDELTGFLDEKVLVVPRAKFMALEPQQGCNLRREATTRLARLIQSDGFFLSRSQAESRYDLVQPIAICVIRYRDEIFVVKRRESSRRHRLHDAIAVWVGGHVRQEDAKPEGMRGALRVAIRRELDEEVLLSLNGSANLDRIVGFVWDDSNDKSQIHIGMIHEIEAPHRDAKLALSQTEFVERRGTSLSGTFYPLSKITTTVKEPIELWSYYLLTQLYKQRPGTMAIQGTLFRT